MPSPAGRRFSKSSATYECSQHLYLLLNLLIAAVLLVPWQTRAASYYSQHLADPKAVHLAGPSGGDDTAALQHAIDQVQETTGQGIVFLPEGRYRINGTLYVWPGIRLIGYGRHAARPCPARPTRPDSRTPSHEKVMIFFAGRPPWLRAGSPSQPGPRRGDPFPMPVPGTFYSAFSNIDIEIEDGNAGAVAVRARYAQHCFLAHMDFRLGPALAGIHEGGNVVEDVRFFGGRYAIWTSKPSPAGSLPSLTAFFEGQREAAIFEREAGLTLIRPRFLRVPTAVAIEPGWADELWIKDARLEEVSGPAFRFRRRKQPAQRDQHGGRHLPRRARFCRVARQRPAFHRTRGNLHREDLFPRPPLLRHWRRAADQDAL